MGAAVMFVAAVLAVAAGALRWPWYALFAPALVWVLGYALHKPQLLPQLREGGTLGSTFVSMFLVLSIACGVLFGVGRLGAAVAG